jgi:hypothetical protein
MYIAMTAKDAVEHYTKLLEAAQAAVADDSQRKPYEYVIYAQDNRGREVVLNFNNDDMERPEMAGRVIVDND